MSGQLTSCDTIWLVHTLSLRQTSSPWSGYSQRDPVMLAPRSWRGGPYSCEDLISQSHTQGSHNQHADALSCKPVIMVAISNELDNTVIAAVQKSDPLLDTVIRQITSKETPSLTNNWRNFPLKRFYQIWSQLTLHETVLYCKVKMPTMQEEKLLLIVPTPTLEECP